MVHLNAGEKDLKLPLVALEDNMQFMDYRKINSSLENKALKKFKIYQKDELHFDIKTFYTKKIIFRLSCLYFGAKIIENNSLFIMLKRFSGFFVCCS